MTRRTWLRAVPVLALLLVIPGPARAQCTFQTLSSNVPYVSAAQTERFRIGQAVGTFMAVGIRSAPGSQHGVSLYTTTAPSPTCVSGLLASSSLPSGVTLLVGDSRPGHNPTGARFGEAVRTSGNGSVTIEWEGTARELYAAAPPESVVTAPAVLDLYQAFLEAGNTYTINFAPSGSNLKLLVFQNPAPSGTYWETRGGPQMIATITQPTLFTASASTDYAFVVVNDDGAAGSYTLWVELCQAPHELVSGVAEPVTYPYRTLMDAVDPYWQAVGLRSAPGADWNIAVYDSGGGSPEPVCFGAELAASNLSNGVDFVVGDLSAAPLKPFFARASLASGAGGALEEWDGGPDEILVNDANPVLRSTDSGDVLESWDAFLLTGHQYTVEFTPSGSAALRWFLFANPNQGGGGAAWFDRTGAVLSATGNAPFSPTTSGWHGLVVVNQDGGSGGYSLAIKEVPGVDAGDPGAPRTALGGIVPNPSRGRAVIAYSLARAAAARIEIIDVAGRRVAMLDAGVVPAGAATLTWDGRGASGDRPAAGVYFARLYVDAVPIGAARMVLLR